MVLPFLFLYLVMTRIGKDLCHIQDLIECLLMWVICMLRTVPRVRCTAFASFIIGPPYRTVMLMAYLSQKKDKKLHRVGHLKKIKQRNFIEVLSSRQKICNELVLIPYKVVQSGFMRRCLKLKACCARLLVIPTSSNS